MSQKKMEEENAAQASKVEKSRFCSKKELTNFGPLLLHRKPSRIFCTCTSIKTNRRVIHLNVIPEIVFSKLILKCQVFR